MAEHPQAAPLPPGARPDPNADPRDGQIEAAAKELIDFMRGWTVTHNLTAIEYSYILGTAAMRQIQQLCIRERTAMRGQG